MARTEQLTRVPTPRRQIISLSVVESMRIAFESLRSNKTRTFLTMLGIIIGVWSVVSLLAIGNGAQKTIIDQVQGIGTNLLSLLPGQIESGGPQTATAELTLQDAEFLERSVPELSAVAPMFQFSAQLVSGSTNRTVPVIGATEEMAEVRNLEIVRGQFFTEQMDQAGRAVAVIGHQVLEDVFGSSDPIGQSIRLNGQSFRVIGVLKESGGFANEDQTIYVPLTTGYRSLFDARATSGGYQVQQILLQVRSEDEIDLATQKIELLMRQRRGLPSDGAEDDFTVFSQASLLTAFSTVTTVMTVFLGAIAGISLLVGGIGVMNIMLVSVTERTKEIGLRKAVGAKRSDILRQFLIESLVMSVLGGLVGLILGWLTATAIGIAFAEYITPVVTLGSMVLAVSFSAAVGLFFGIYPALRAARLNPIQALRYE